MIYIYKKRREKKYDAYCNKLFQSLLWRFFFFFFGVNKKNKVVQSIAAFNDIQLSEGIKIKHVHLSDVV